MSKYNDLTNNNTIPLYPKYKTEFYKAEKALVEYKYPIALLGTRRTGKTVIMKQLWEKYSTNKSKFVRMHEYTDWEVLLELIQECTNTNCDYLFIDEVTNVECLDIHLGDCLDYVIDTFGAVKIIMSGTNSYLLELASHDSACGRLNIINFNPPNWFDYKNILGASFYDFMMGNKCFYDKDNYIIDLAKDIKNAMNNIGNVHTEPYDYIEIENISYMLTIIAENLVAEVHNIPRLCLLFRRKYYHQPMLNDKIDGKVKMRIYKHIVYGIAGTNIFTYNKIYSVTNKDLDDRVYLNTPMIFKNIMRDYNKVPKADKEGYIFEAIAYSQIYTILKEYNDRLYIFTFQDEAWAIEYDMVIINEDSCCVFFIDFKRSAKNSISHIRDSRVLSHFYKYKCKFYTIYLFGESSNPNKFEIEYFLQNFNKIPGLLYKRTDN